MVSDRLVVRSIAFAALIIAVTFVAWTASRQLTVPRPWAEEISSPDPVCDFESSRRMPYYSELCGEYWDAIGVPWMVERRDSTQPLTGDDHDTPGDQADPGPLDSILSPSYDAPRPGWLLVQTFYHNVTLAMPADWELSIFGSVNDPPEWRQDIISHPNPDDPNYIHISIRPARGTPGIDMIPAEQIGEGWVGRRDYPALFYEQPRSGRPAALLVYYEAAGQLWQVGIAGNDFPPQPGTDVWDTVNHILTTIDHGM